MLYCVPQDALGMTPFALAVALSQYEAVDAIIERAVTSAPGIAGGAGGGDGDVFVDAPAPEPIRAPFRRGGRAAPPAADGACGLLLCCS